MEQTHIWMVRIGGEIIGPLSAEDIADKILAHQITGIDEVARPCSSWYYVRDVDRFLGVLEKANLNKASTSSNSLTSTKTSQNTMTYTAQLDSDKTQDVVDVIRLEDTQPLEDQNILSGNKKNVAEEKAALNLNQLRQNEKQRQKKRKRNSILLVLLFFVFVGVGGFVLKDKILQFGKMKFSDPYQLAKAAWIVGDFRDALAHMKSCIRSGKDLKNLETPYVALLLLEEQDTRKAQQQLSQRRDKSTAEWKNLNGLVRMYERRRRDAEKYFLSAVETNPFYLPALTNLGLIYRKEKDWNSAKSFFESAYSKGAETDLAAFLLAEAWVRDVMNKGDLTDLRNVQTFLNNHLTMASSYSYELNFLQLWIKKLQRFDVRDNLNALLKVDPYIVDLRKQSPYNFRFDFSDFLYICNDFKASQNIDTTWAAVYGLCLTLAGQEKRALKALDNALSLNASDPNLLALKSLALDFSGQEQEASLALSEAMANNISDEEMLPLYMQAHFCQRRGDYKCSARFWQSIIEKDVQSATAYAGLAKAYYEVGSVDKSQNLIKKAGALNSELRTYLELKTTLLEQK